MEIGDRVKTKYWGHRTYKKIARLKKPVECYNPEQGTVLFDPTIVQIEWDRPPSQDKNEFWFPYWVTIDGTRKYGQFAPMMGEQSLLELLQDAIEQDFFTETFLNKLRRAITKKLTRTISIGLEDYKKQLYELRTIIQDGVAYFSAWLGIANLDDNMAQALNRFRAFFLPAQLSLKHMALLQFAKVFDSDPRTVSLRNLLSAVKNNPSLLAPHAREDDLQKLENKIDDNEELLNRLKTFRDQCLVHHDSAISADTSLPLGQVKQLIDDVKDMYNSLSRGHERSITSFDFMSCEATRHTLKVIEIMCEEKNRAILKIQEADKLIGNGG